MTLFARPGSGWSEVGRGLTDLATATAVSHHGDPLPVGTPDETMLAIAAELGAPTIPETGMGATGALTTLGDLIARYGLDLTHQLCAAHLQPPPLTVAVIADALASATNASLDTYDSGPATLAVERWTVASLARLAGLPETSGGVFGPGGSYSNLLAMLVARDETARRRGIDVRRAGVRDLVRPVVFCSSVAHFSINRACAALGLGESAVIPVAVDADHRMIPEALEAAIGERADSQTPVAIVATAGTTDFGTVDPLPEVADIARRHGIWLHVDAAYGFGALFSSRLAPLLGGLGRADSVTLDLHKVGWQPAAASVLLLADESRFASLNRSVSYLNPEDDEEAGYGGLLGLTLQTTRRPDVLKVAATLLAFGRGGLGSMLDTCHELARYAESRIATELQLEMVAPVTLTTVVFRYRCQDSNTVNAELRRRLISSGTALIGRTEVRVRGEAVPTVCLKLTLLNPETSEQSIDALFDEITRVGMEVETSQTRFGDTTIITR
ncbi:pyridoxal phosphate-dependent decarboxylase family protein [Gordonia sp. NPDC003425]